MSRFVSFLKSAPLFVWLLPLFFVFHGFVENFNAVPVGDAFVLFLNYSIAVSIIFLLCWLFFRQVQKAALATVCIMAFHFFFGAIQDFLKTNFHVSIVSRYSFLLPLSVIFFVTVFWILKKARGNRTKTVLYLNVLVGILLVVDVAGLTRKMAERKTIFSAAQSYVPNCDTCTRPDIYLLLFDEYQSTAALKNQWDFDNSEMDTFLLNRGFRLLPQSRSNYSFTQFSMASMLNMDYLSVPNPQACTVEDYNRCYELIKTNRVCETLSTMGYQIVNYSVFDLPGNPTMVREDFLPLKTKLITEQTFLSRIQKDLGYHLLTGRFEIKWLSSDLIYTTLHNNEKIIKAVLNDTSASAAAPRFVYSHIEMPHAPYYYDSSGNLRDKKTLIPHSNLPYPEGYLEYFPATNRVVKQIVDHIIQNSKKPVAILLMGDHGFRYGEPNSAFFSNLNAVYLSSGDYRGFYDSISNVNQFRVLFNNLFNAHYPLKKDSTITLEDQ